MHIVDQWMCARARPFFIPDAASPFLLPLLVSFLLSLSLAFWYVSVAHRQSVDVAAFMYIASPPLPVCSMSSIW